MFIFESMMVLSENWTRLYMALNKLVGNGMVDLTSPWLLMALNELWVMVVVISKLVQVDTP